MRYNEFSDDEKIKMFDTIASKYFEANFGQTSKADIELLMFHFYIEKMISNNTDETGIIDFNACSDYKISKDLGITQQRVRNLKIKNQLVYPVEFDWEKALATLVKNARYDKASSKIVLHIPDPNLYLEIQNFIEEKGAFVEKQLNTKVLQLRAEYFIDLVVSLEPENSRKEIIKRLKKSFKDEGKDEKAFNEKCIGKSLLDMAINISTVVANVSSCISPSNFVGDSLFDLLCRNQ